MKNRIGSKWTSAGLAAVLLAGAMMSCVGAPAGVTAADAGAGKITLTQTAAWTDRESWKGIVTIEAAGLENLRTEEQTSLAPEEDSFSDEAVLRDFSGIEPGIEGLEGENLPEEEPPSGERLASEREQPLEEELPSDENMVSEGNLPLEGEPPEEELPSGESLAPEGNLPREGEPPEGELPEEEAPSGESTAAPETSAPQTREPVFVMYLSEYFLLDESAYTAPEGWTTQEIPIVSREGRATTITRISGPVRAEHSWQLTVPAVLRREYQYPAAARTFPVSQDAPLEKSQRESEAPCAAGTFIMEEREGAAELLAYTESALLEAEAARADFSLSLEAQQEEPKAGQRLYYQLTLENTGETSLKNISLTAAFSPMELEPLWESDNNLKIEENKAIVPTLKQGERKTLTFSVKPEEGQSGAATAAVTALALHPGADWEEEGEEGEALIREAALPVVIAPLRAAFTVEKTADCEEAGPGDTITYQICIRNTGERTLHSVIGTERFLHSNIRAQFEEAEGIELNGTKTQARIPEIPPGDCVNLKARVTLPDAVADQNLINQVIVVADETGEDQAVRSQAEVKVAAEPEPSPSAGGASSANVPPASRTSPKTGDSSHREVFEALLLCSLFLSAAAGIRLFTAWRREEKGKRKH